MDSKKRIALNNQIWLRLKAIGWRYELTLGGHYIIRDSQGNERAYRGTLNAAFMECRKEIEAIENVHKATAAIEKWNASVLKG